ncbi:MAG: ABC transporter ATP-binding protein [Phycisphaeraceae bacterium]|nr:ABC transporter ATP-binding protein [Phycisphaeraceae bacterium]
MITISHLTKRFGRAVAVDDASLRIDAGDSVALWGANGAGKTTLIRCVLGLLRYKGVVTVGGHDVTRRGKPARMCIGYVPQELGFYDDLRVAEAVRFFAALKGLRVPSTDSVLATVGLVGHDHKRIRELSGGMKQRLALAIAMLGDPPVLVLDEVTASLDACGRSEFVSLLARLSGSGRTMLFASHRVEEVASLARRVVTMDRGRITSVVPAAEFAASATGGAVLHLMLSPSVREHAILQLRAEGFAASLNGVGVLVRVSPERKAAPFRVLADARIRVDDFEMLSGDHARTHSVEAQS